MSVFRWTIGVLILTSLLACRKEELALMWDQQLSNTDELLTSVFFSIRNMVLRSAGRRGPWACLYPRPTAASPGRPIP